jgi:cyclophilin family peptidyl-prolyl cis-trans isomerase
MTLKRQILLLLAVPAAVFLISASSCEGPTADGEKAKKRGKDGDKTLVKIETPYGDMVAWLYDETPMHRDNFVKLADSGFYDDLIFHRVISQFMIQGGDPNSRDAVAGVPLGSGGPGYTVPAEFNPNFIHKKGALSAARQGDQVNPLKASSGSQFYIVQGKVAPESELMNVEHRMNARRDSVDFFHYTPEQIQTYATVGGTPFLDQGYTVFGEVIEGLNVIDSIAAVKKDPRDRPLQDVKMKISVIRK